MRKLPGKPLHLAIILILVVVGGLYLYSDRQKQRYDVEAGIYLRSALADIGSWDAAALRRHFASEANAAVTDAQLQAMLQRYRPLGAFQRLDDLEFTRLTAALSLFSGNTLLSYSAQARFRNGSAHIAATLVRRDGQFQLYNFNLSTPQLDPAH
jgi:hypothetical protein